MACTRSCRFLFRLAVANNVRHHSTCNLVNVNLTPSVTSKVISRNVRGRMNPTLKLNHSSEISEYTEKPLEENSNSENPLKNQENSNSGALTDPSSSLVEVTEQEESVEGVLNQIQMEKDNLAVNNCLYYLRSIVHYYKNNKTNLSLNEILNSSEFFLLLKTYQKQIGTGHPDHLAEILINLEKLNVPDNAVIMLQTLRLLKQDFNNLSFSQAYNLYRYVKKLNRNSDASAIKIALQEALPLKFKETFDRDNEKEVKNALFFLCESPQVLSPCAMEICDAVINICESKGDEFSLAVIHLLLKGLKFVDKNDPRYQKLSLMSFNIVKKIALMDLPSKRMDSVLIHYAYLVTGMHMEYDEIVVDKLGEKVIESNVPAFKKLVMLHGMTNMRHNQIEIADYFADLVIEDPKLIMNHSSVHEFIKFLFNTNFKNLRKEKWEKLKPIIEDLPVLKDESLWTNFIVSDLAIDLIGLDIFPDYILQALQRKYDNKNIVKEDWIKIKILVAINQAVNLWHPHFDEPVLSKSTVELIVQFYKEKLAGEKRWPLEVKTFLELATGVKDSIFINCYTQGCLIQEVMVLNNENKPMSPTALLKDLCKGPMSIENLQSILQTKKLVLMLNYGRKSYSVNTRKLYSLASVTVKALEARGFLVIPILEDEWFELDERERGPYLWKCIEEKIPDSWKSGPSIVDKVTAAKEKIKDSISASVQKITGSSNFFRYR